MYTKGLKQCLEHYNCGIDIIIVVVVDIIIIINYPSTCLII